MSFHASSFLHLSHNSYGFLFTLLIWDATTSTTYTPHHRDLVRAYNSGRQLCHRLGLLEGGARRGSKKEGTGSAAGVAPPDGCSNSPPCSTVSSSAYPSDVFTDNLYGNPIKHRHPWYRLFSISKEPISAFLKGLKFLGSPPKTPIIQCRQKDVVYSFPAGVCRPGKTKTAQESQKDYSHSP